MLLYGGGETTSLCEKAALLCMKKLLFVMVSYGTLKKTTNGVKRTPITSAMDMAIISPDDSPFISVFYLQFIDKPVSKQSLNRTELPEPLFPT